MTRTTTTTLAVAADYADAMLVARRAKNWLFLLLLLTILTQIAVFCVARFVPGIHLSATISTGNPSSTATTQTTDVAIVQRPADSHDKQALLSPLFQELIGVTDVVGITASILLGIVLLLIVTIMLVGRLVGVTHLTSAFVWTGVLLLVLFPWQALLNTHGTWVRFTHDVKGQHAGDVVELDASAANAFIAADAAERTAPMASADVRIPGVLYTWGELVRDFNFSTADLPTAVLKWARFVGFPLLALVLLLNVQTRSSRGLRFALGESELKMEVTTTPPI